ncbi:MAG: hypothetical protein WA116_00980 [Anaerolineaceae bacterium]
MDWLIELLDKVPLDQALAVSAFAIIANRLIAGFITPLFEKYKLDKFWLMYISWIVAGLLVWATDINLFEAYIPNELIGTILTALVAGGSANIVYDRTDAGTTVVIEGAKMNESLKDIKE